MAVEEKVEKLESIYTINYYSSRLNHGVHTHLDAEHVFVQASGKMRIQQKPINNCFANDSPNKAEVT